MPKQTYLNLCEIFDKNEKDVNEFLIQNNLNNLINYSRLNKLIKKKNKFYNFVHSPLKTTKSIQSNGISVDLFQEPGIYLGFEKEGLIF